ncbi:universal stress protein [Mycolicibacterium lacusdiani]|uniref:universal stress protein n=1 Tax=Mycolicibacterium lacusdiani TaxID=2895283 RepID=UPI001F23C792|nr:universal stress protein [Mycolicibacterium lacusdiani]
MIEASAPIIVGIDGSAAALNAARWAATEARNELTTMRLVFAVPESSTTDDRAHDVRRACRALEQASGAVSDLVPSLIVRTAIRHGTPDRVLLDESRGAAMLCVGAEPRRHGVGLLAAALAEKAACTVAIVRDTAPARDGVVAVVLDDAPGNDEVVHRAMREGRMRRAVVRQVDCRQDSWVRRFPDVHVEMVPPGGIRTTDHERPAVPQLAVVGTADAARLGDPARLESHPIHGYPDCTVLVVRG